MKTKAVRYSSRIDHTLEAHLDTPTMRALREDYDDADDEIQELKAKVAQYEALGSQQGFAAWKDMKARAIRAEEELMQMREKYGAN